MDVVLKRGIQYIVSLCENESQAVKIAVDNLRCDIGKILGIEAVAGEVKDATIVVGTIGVSEVIDQMIENKTIDISGIKRKDQEDGQEFSEKELSEKELSEKEIFENDAKEIFKKDVSEKKGVGKGAHRKNVYRKNVYRKEAYVITVQLGKIIITGSDRRGTIYGIYELSKMIGVSPWYFWADVPVKEKESFCLNTGYMTCDYPSVEYRGIFINDEEELDRWAGNYMKESTIGVKTYEKVFELLLRLKGNYIWPAMHVNSFNQEKENGELAEKMGIVVGTSHCDMLMRSNNREWKPWLAKKEYQNVRYDYSIPGRNRDILKEYWQESVEQNKDYEVCYTLGMRGIHDSGLESRDLAGSTEEEKKQAKIKLLSKIIEDQYKMLKDTLKDTKNSEPMMTFIPYKEVLPLYDSGMQIPEDVTLVWANDNYGYIRRYPSDQEKLRKGGNGIYYHNSYWAPPSMSYVFQCSIPLAHTRYELSKAYQEGIQKLWVLNVGSIKPLEQEVEFFLRLGWEIGKENVLTADVDAYVKEWIDSNFSGNVGEVTAALLNDFSQLTNVRKIENMSADTFSQRAYGDEAVIRIHKYEEMFCRGNMIYENLPEREKAAYFQLVLYRIHAAYFTNLQYYYGDRSTWMYERGMMKSAAFYTEKAQEFDDARRKLIVYYNTIMVHGKWNGISDPEGFPPPRTAMMPICTPPLEIGKKGMRLNLWNDESEITFVIRRKNKGSAVRSVKWFEIGNTGTGHISYSIKAPDWVKLSNYKGTVEREQRIFVSLQDNDMDAEQGVITVTKEAEKEVDKETVTFAVKCRNVDTDCLNVEDDGIVVVDAIDEELSEAKNVEQGVRTANTADLLDEAENTGITGGDFKVVKRLGRGRGALLECCCQRELGDGQDVSELSGISYKICTLSEGEFLLELHRFPSLNSTGRIRIGLTVDDGILHVLETESNDEWRGNWKANVLNNVDRMYMKLPKMSAGEHIITFYGCDRYFAWSRFVLYTKERKENNYAGIHHRMESGAHSEQEHCADQVAECAKAEQELPKLWDSETWIRGIYGNIELCPRPVFYTRVEDEKDDLGATDLIVLQDKYAEKTVPKSYIAQGSSIYTEKSGHILIDAASVLAGSRYAWTEQCEVWKHCSSESYGRSGMAMYTKKCRTVQDIGSNISQSGIEAGDREKCRTDRWKAENAPSLCYRILCEGGDYKIWLLSKLEDKQEAYFSLRIDGKILEENELYHGGCLWKYEAEQIYRWVPLTVQHMEKGEHKLELLALAAGMRYDRIFITSGSELPVLDLQWRT